MATPRVVAAKARTPEGPAPMFWDTDIQSPPVAHASTPSRACRQAEWMSSSKPTIPMYNRHGHASIRTDFGQGRELVSPIEEPPSPVDLPPPALPGRGWQDRRHTFGPPRNSTPDSEVTQKPPHRSSFGLELEPTSPMRRDTPDRSESTLPEYSLQTLRNTPESRFSTQTAYNVRTFPANASRRVSVMTG